MKRNIFLGLILGLSILLSLGFEYPSFNNKLFKIGRSKDANEIFYYANIDNDKLNRKNPISISWIKKTNGNKFVPLTWIQNKYAYGLKFISKSSNTAKFHFVSYKKRKFELKKNKQGTYSVFTFLGKKEVEVDRIYIQIDGGTFWFPKISQVELHASEVESNAKIIEIIKP